MYGTLSASTVCSSCAPNLGSLFPGRGGIPLLATLFGGAHQCVQFMAGLSKAWPARYSDERNIWGKPFITDRAPGRRPVGRDRREHVNRGGSSDNCLGSPSQLKSL